MGIGNAMVAVAGNMMIAFHNAIRSVQSWFYRLLSTALTVVAGICEALNGLPFVDFDYSGLTSAALEYADKAAEADGDKEEYQSVIDAFNEGFQTFETFQEGWIADAYNAGADWGDGIAERAKNFDLKDILELDIGSEKDYEVSAEDYASMLGSSVVGSGVDDIAENTGAVRDSLEVNTEELKYLRDLAERDIVNRFTTAEIKADMSGMQNTVNSGDDIDGFMTRLTDSVNEAVDNMAEGVHQ
ncbi:MAG: phage tail protein [Lachnospiraceae bacterium]|nr:phage tail protein [Lachnospiraceae bacterium]